eukprot:m.125811 g.125811  ORF g.125811 m.125811 type:complete len:613 (+) comp37880_c0_seq16:187-2025(+)
MAMAAHALDDAKAKLPEGKAKQSYKKFVWDELLQYMALVSGVLVLIGLGSEYFLDRGLACTVARQMSRDEARFAVMWCSSDRHVRLVDMLPFVVFLQGLFLAGSHLLWETSAGSALEQFFAMAPSLSRLRDRQTGQYPFETVQIVRKLRDSYGNSGGNNAKNTSNIHIFSKYAIKLWVQLIASLACLLALIILSAFNDLFAVNFVCSEVGGFDQFGYQNTSFIVGYNPYDTLCTYTTATSMLTIWIADIVVLIITTGAAIVGIVWCRLPHWYQLDYRNYARFLYSFSMNDTSRARQSFQPSSKYKKTVKIQNDLDFLVMLLYNKDNGQGETFFDVQVELELEELFRVNFEDFSSYFSQLTIPKFKKSTEEINRLVKLVKDKLAQAEDEEECAFGKRLQELCYDELLSTRRLSFPEDLHVSNEPIPRVPYAVPLFICGLHLFCGSKGCTLLLLQLCREMTAVDFNTFFNPALTRNKPLQDDEKDKPRRNETESPKKSTPKSPDGHNDSNTATRREIEDKDVVSLQTPLDRVDSVLEENYSSLTFVRVSGSITSREGPQQTPLNERLASRGDNKRMYDLIVITCLEPHFQPSSGIQLCTISLAVRTVCYSKGHA